MIDWERLIKERNEWVAHNFPDPKIPNPQESILGVIEEVGELAHAHLKGLQNIRGAEEDHIANAKDAVGDSTIYLLGVCAQYGTIPGTNSPPDKLSTPQKCIGVAARWAGVLLDEDYPLDQVAIDKIVCALEAYCEHRGWDYEIIVYSIWNKVKKRDWQKDPQTGGESTPSFDMVSKPKETGYPRGE